MSKVVDIYIPLDSRDSANRAIWPVASRQLKELVEVIAGCGPTRDHGKWLAEQKAAGYTFYVSVGNVAEWESTVEAFKLVKAEHGPVDVLVNNAGITRDGLFPKMTRSEWDAVININLEQPLQRHQTGDRRHARPRLGPHHQHHPLLTRKATRC